MNFKLMKKELVTVSMAIALTTVSPQTTFASGGPSVEQAQKDSSKPWLSHKIAGGYVTVEDQRLPQGENIYNTAWPVNADGFYTFPYYLKPIDFGREEYPRAEEKIVMVYDQKYGKEGMVSAPFIPGYGVTLPDELVWVSDSLSERGVKQEIGGLPNSSLSILPAHPASVYDTRTKECYNISYPINPQTGSMYELPSYLMLMPYQPNFEEKESTFAKIADPVNHRYGLGRIYLDEEGNEIIDLPETMSATTRVEAVKKQYTK